MRGDGFFVRPFSCDGLPVGSGFWRFADLSSHWLSSCKDLLNEHGGVFDADWRGNLSHIRTKFTSAAGAAVVTFFVHRATAASALLLSGTSPAAEPEIIGLFVESLKRTADAGALATEVDSFANIDSAERPVMAVVTWPDPRVTDEDHCLVRELNLHLAGSFFSRNPSDTLQA